MRRLAGVLPALPTPFRDGAVDHERLADLCRDLIDAGVDGLVACGTTGEGATLDLEETVAVTRTVLEAAAGAVPVVVGTGSNDTRRTVALTEAVAQAGAAAALVVTPYYNKPNRAGLVAHTRAVAAVGLPVVLYNVPGRTGLDLPAEVMVELGEIDGVVGLKDASRNMEKAIEVRARLGDAFSLLSGDDFTILPFLACGGDGVITVVGNVAPRQTVALVRAFSEGRLEEARRWQGALLPLIRALFAESNPIPLKGLLADLGRIGPEVRAPLAAANEATLAAARAALEAVPEVTS